MNKLFLKILTKTHVKKCTNRIVFFLWLFGVLIVNGQAQSRDTILSYNPFYTYFLEETKQSENPENSTKLESELLQFIAVQKTKKTKSRSEIRFLRQLNRQIHDKFLKNYARFSSFSETLQNGNYDCLSGVILYVVVLDTLGYNYTIYQTNYHVYLMLSVQGRDILIETTDPIYGFVESPYHIQKRQEEYEVAIEVSKTTENYYTSPQKIHQPTSVRELRSLHFYNQAVGLYNQRKLVQASKRLTQAEAIYTSQRTQELRLFINYYQSQFHE